MFSCRISLIVGVFLSCEITAKPYQPWNKPPEGAFQDTVMSIDDKGKMSMRVEVEPPEDMDETQYDIDPHMMIWKSMKGSQRDKQPPEAEEDFDEIYHPSTADLLKVQNQFALPAADIQTEPLQKEAKVNYYEQPEEDRDDIDHPVFSEVASRENGQDWDETYHDAGQDLNGYLVPLKADAGRKADAEVHVAYSEPEKDEDDLYHHDDQHMPVQMELLRHEVRGERRVRLYLEPEEDMDVLYHKDIPQPVLYQDVAEAVAPIDLPSPRKHSEPEEDLDGLYHQ